MAMTESERRKRKAAIFKWLIENGITQTEVAKACNVKLAMVCMWVAGKRSSAIIAEYFRTRGMPETLIYKGFRKAA